MHDSLDGVMASLRAGLAGMGEASLLLGSGEALGVLLEAFSLSSSSTISLLSDFGLNYAHIKVSSAWVSGKKMASCCCLALQFRSPLQAHHGCCVIDTGADLKI